MIHAALRWPDTAKRELWPLALNHAVWLHNNTPRSDSTFSPEELWCRSKSSHSDLQRTHVWGCPVFGTVHADDLEVPKQWDEFLTFQTTKSEYDDEDYVPELSDEWLSEPDLAERRQRPMERKSNNRPLNPSPQRENPSSQREPNRAPEVNPTAGYDAASSQHSPAPSPTNEPSHTPPPGPEPDPQPSTRLQRQLEINFKDADKW